ncbi:MAG TPA: hypothetical protein VEZ90_17790 [Blastocatellia bacterium]|nr:hypothetical protein [Blastocatellia bacterium]
MTWNQIQSERFQIRQFVDSDAAAVDAINDAIYPEYRDAGSHAAEQFDVQRFTPYRYLAEAQNVVGYGIATALKLSAIKYARDAQAGDIVTCTANPTMLAINEKLGYVRQLAEARMVRTVHSRSKEQRLWI